MTAHQSYQRDWCLRVKADFNTEMSQFVASGAKQQIVETIRQSCVREEALSVKTQWGHQEMILTGLSTENRL